MKDPAKKRHAYLRKILSLQLSAGIALSIAVVFGLLTVHRLFLYYEVWSRGAPMGMSYAYAFAILPFIALCGWTLRQRLAQTARVISYVPPVREQIAALPAEAVLVRGSEEPAALPDVLLRAAHAGTVAPEEELLRAETRVAE